MNRLEKVISANLKEENIKREDLDYYFSAKRRECICSKNGKLIYTFSIYKTPKMCGVNKYNHKLNIDSLSSMDEIEQLKKEGYIIEDITIDNDDNLN